MKVVLLTLSGDESRARATLLKRYPGSEVVQISRGEFEKGGMAGRLRNLRALRPDVFAVATERLAWQRGQNALLLFGVLAGAQSAIMLDAHGGFRKESRSRLLLSSPVRLARVRVLSAATVARAKRDLRRLESAVKESLPLRHQRTVTTGLDIAYLRATPGPGTQAGGAATHITGVTEGLRELGAEVSIVSNDIIAGFDERELTIIEPEPQGGTRAVFEIHNNAVFTQGAVPLIERNPPEFIYQRYARFGWAGVVASLSTKRPLFLEYNGSEVWVGRHWDHVGMLDLLERYERLNLTAAARIFVVSEVERRNLVHAGIPLEKIVVNPNGVDTEVFRPSVGGARVRRELEIGDQEILVGFVGSFGPWHGVLTLAEAIKEIPATSRVRFLLVGSGSLHAKVKQKLRAEEQQSRVIFTGSVDHEQVPALLDACDMLVSPHVPLSDGSEFFGSPTKIFEYMAMGKGIVASRLGQIADVLTHEETALLVEPGNAQQLSAAIIRLAEEKAFREHLGATARKAAIERHTWKRNAQNVLDAYNAWLVESH